eukprot:gene15182-16744_t
MAQQFLQNKKLIIFALVVVIQIGICIWYFEGFNVKIKENFYQADIVGSNKNITSDELSADLLQKKEEFVKIILDGTEQITLKYYREMKEYNQIRVSYHKDCSQDTLKDPNAIKKFVVVTNFIYLTLEKYKKNLFIGGGLKLNDTNIKLRIMEVLHVLESNLQHPFIEEVHVLVKEKEAVEFLRHLPLKNSKKMVIHVPEEDVSMRTQVKYAGQCLMNKIVAISHQDNRFGKGWDKFRPDILKEKRIAYALTRHTPEVAPCAGAKSSANCDPGYPYLGSHDVFMFFVRETFTTEQLKDLENVTPNLSGMENLLIWVFVNRWNFHVLNPCYLLHVHHHHCIPLRDQGRRRVNTAATTGTAGFTDKLE